MNYLRKIPTFGLSGWKLYIVLGIIISVVMCALGYCVFGDTQENFEAGQTQIRLFSVDWCPHCQKFAPEWEQLKQNGPSEITYTKIDGDAKPKLLEKYKVQSYPTIIIENNGELKEYDGERTSGAIISHLNSL